MKKSNPLMRGAIVAMSGKFLTDGQVIGVDGVLPWHYSSDLKRFQKRTMDCAVIMGRKTWDSIGRKALPDRRNIVISRSDVPGVEHYHDISSAIEACNDQDLWVIGGAQIYQAAMPYLNLLDITYVPDVIDRDDAVKFPEIHYSDWRWKRRNKVPNDKRLVYIIYRRVGKYLR